MTTLTIQPDGVEAPFAAWCDGEVLDANAKRLAAVLIAAAAPVRVHEECGAVPAGWDALERAVATLRAIYGDPLNPECDDVDVAELWSISDEALKLFGDPV